MASLYAQAAGATRTSPLKAQLDLLCRRLALYEGKFGRKPIDRHACRAGLAYLLTRREEIFQQYFLSATLRTITRWATRFRTFDCRRGVGGRKPTDEKLVELIVTMKRESRGWGQRRIQEELRRMEIRVSQPTVQRILCENGFRGGRSAP